MKRWKIGALILLAAVTSAHAIKVDHEYVEHADFSGYKTFGWKMSQARLDTLVPNEKLIMQLLERELAAKGFTLSTADSPDFYVNFSLGAQAGVAGARYTFGQYTTYGASVFTTRGYAEGTLTVDVIDAAEDRLIWRGWATGAVDDPDKAAKKIDKAVRKLMRIFPHE